jgi:hypothetical protein
MPKPVVPKPMRNCSCSNGSTTHFKDVAKKHGVTYDIVRGVLKRYVKGEIDWCLLSKCYASWGWMKSLKGHSDPGLRIAGAGFVTLASAQDENGKLIVLAVLKGREKKTRVDFLKTIPKRLQDTQRSVHRSL